MREPRYKIWNKKTERMVDPHLTTPLALNSDCADLKGVFLPFHKDLILIQGTGLKDKNDKEVFDGDVVKVYGNKAGHIRWSDILARFVFSKLGNYPAFAFNEKTVKEDFEVIGNIYENPTLLED